MVDLIFTIDYEIYGNGEGSLHELVFEPAKTLKSIFDRANRKFVVFAEAAELAQIDRARSDSGIDKVKGQVRELHEDGFEIGLHLHPQWCNAEFRDGKWHLDYTEYNLCTLSKDRINKIVEESLVFLGEIIGMPDFRPTSFRAGNWLLQPTSRVGQVLSEHGFNVDSSVFKGGRQHNHALDYRGALKNGDYWTFSDDAATIDPNGTLLEIPIYSEYVPFWRMATKKRISLQAKASSARRSSDRLGRLRDFARFRQPLKLDFCRMTADELIGMTERVLRDDRDSPESYRPIVLIGHTKDLVDFPTIEEFLSYLDDHRVTSTDLRTAYFKCQSLHRGMAAHLSLV